MKIESSFQNQNKQKGPVSKLSGVVQSKARRVYVQLCPIAVPKKAPRGARLRNRERGGSAGHPTCPNLRAKVSRLGRFHWPDLDLRARCEPSGRAHRDSSRIPCWKERAGTEGPAFVSKRFGHQGMVDETIAAYLSYQSDMYAHNSPTSRRAAAD
jgi:hypothetical protein